MQQQLITQYTRKRHRSESMSSDDAVIERPRKKHAPSEQPTPSVAAGVNVDAPATVLTQAAIAVARSPPMKCKSKAKSKGKTKAKSKAKTKAEHARLLPETACGPKEREAAGRMAKCIYNSMEKTTSLAYVNVSFALPVTARGMTSSVRSTLQQLHTIYEETTLSGCAVTTLDFIVQPLPAWQSTDAALPPSSAVLGCVPPSHLSSMYVGQLKKYTPQIDSWSEVFVLHNILMKNNKKYATLPHELVRAIFEYIDNYVTFVAVKRVCKSWCSVANDMSVKRYVVKNESARIMKDKNRHVVAYLCAGIGSEISPKLFCRPAKGARDLTTKFHCKACGVYHTHSLHGLRKHSEGPLRADLCAAYNRFIFHLQMCAHIPGYLDAVVAQLDACINEHGSMPMYSSCSKHQKYKFLKQVIVFGAIYACATAVAAASYKGRTFGLFLDNMRTTASSDGMYSIVYPLQTLHWHRVNV